jgi:phage tail sheath protein FI
MPVQVTYPGVYIQELPSGVHTITGVATSNTAFIGWGPQGPTDKAEPLHSFAEYTRHYGDIHPKSFLGDAVHHFFDNGGGTAFVVRLVAGDAQYGTTQAGGIPFTAASKGAWSRFYGVKVKLRDDAKPGNIRFRVGVVQFPTDPSGNPDPTRAIEVEAFENLSANADDYRFVNEVINDLDRGSEFVRAQAVAGQDPQDEPDPKAFDGGVDGTVLQPGDQEFNTGLDAAMADGGPLDQIDVLNIVCVPGLVDEAKLGQVQAYCRKRRAFLIADCDKDAKKDDFQKGPKGELTGDNAINAAFYFPWLRAPDPLSQNRIAEFPPCGFVAGVFARTDASRGVWKAPAGLDASLTGVTGPKVLLNDPQNGDLNIRAVNCIRTFPVYGAVVWGARTLQGDDERGSEWKYIPVRRTALYIEESLYRGLKWVVFEPNDEPLWAQIRLNVGAFMQDQFRKGAFQGKTPRDAYFVRCDKTTTTQNDINRGIVNIIVGFAPLKPAEFVVLTIQQIAGDIQT